jgi:site-specific DNA recombinase
MTAADTLRRPIDKLILTPDTDAPNGHKIELFGELGAILSLCNNEMGTNAKTRTVGAGVGQVTMVAGAGFEPAAFRL